MASWYEAPVLVRLKDDLNMRWPGRDHRSDGSIGDAAHAARSSDHNPAASGVVRARDIDKDGIHVPTVMAALLLHPSTRYVIYSRKIYHIDNLFKPKVYTGSNPHTGHLHVSIEHTKAAEVSKMHWSPIWSPFSWPTVKPGQAGTAVRQLQAYLNGFGAALALDGRYGAGTLKAVKAFQKAKKLDVDGWVGPATQKALRTR